MNFTEPELVRQLKLGDEIAFCYLFDTYYALLCHIAGEFLKDNSMAENVVGDVIFHLWENREKLDIQSSVQAYLVIAVRNRSINYQEQEYSV